ncbi:MAG: hypothetical protein HEP80_13780 [Dolichospermum sp. UKL201]|jgi:hypothetical protein|nr:MAG: hypothetical protein HEP80_13780 [Dolichospermum sp. UKL201]
MSAYQRTIQAFVKLIESESSLFSMEDWDNLDKLASNLPEDIEEISAQIRSWLNLESRSTIKANFKNIRSILPSTLSDETLAPGRAEYPTQQNQFSESYQAQIKNAIKLKPPLSKDKKPQQK